MTENKWAKLRKAGDSTNHTFSEHFEVSLIVAHLNKPYDPSGETNQPGPIINKAKSEVGALSRIFDAFPFPVVTYEELKNIDKDPDGLRLFMDENVKQVLPSLLNQEHTALNDSVITAIGKNNYDDILQTATEKDVAIKLVQAVLLSYGQRVLDETHDEQEKKELFNTLMPKLQGFAESATLNGLSQTTSQDRTVESLSDMLSVFKRLLNEAKESDIDSSVKVTILNILDEGVVWLIDLGNKDKAQSSYHAAVDAFTENAVKTSALAAKEVGWFTKVIRFLFNNEKLLQSTDEKRYTRQLNLLSTLNALMKANDPEKIKSEETHESIRLSSPGQ